MKFEMRSKKDDPLVLVPSPRQYVVSMQCGETLIVRLLDDCGEEVTGLIVGTLRLPEDGSMGISLVLPAVHHRSQRDNYVLLGGIEADELVFWKGEEVAELRLKKVTVDNP